MHRKPPLNGECKDTKRNKQDVSSTEDEGKNSQKKKKKKKKHPDEEPKKDDQIKPQVKKEKDAEIKVKEEKSETQNGDDEDKDKYYFMYINGVKKLIKMVTEDIESDENASDSSIKEAKVPKTLKQFYSVSDSDDEKTKQGNILRQLDGNGNSSTI